MLPNYCLLLANISPSQESPKFIQQIFNISKVIPKTSEENPQVSLHNWTISKENLQDFKHS